MLSLQQEKSLNGLLVNLSHSLLQYCTESWPWTSPEAQETLAKLQGVIREQQKDIASLTDFLLSRDVNVDFGTYPDYTDLNFVGIDFFLSHLIHNQDALVKEAEAVRQVCADDQECGALLAKIHSNALIQLSSIKQLANVPTA